MISTSCLICILIGVWLHWFTEEVLWFVYKLKEQQEVKEE